MAPISSRLVSSRLTAGLYVCLSARLFSLSLSLSFSSGCVEITICMYVCMYVAHIKKKKKKKGNVLTHPSAVSCSVIWWRNPSVQNHPIDGMKWNSQKPVKSVKSSQVKSCHVSQSITQCYLPTLLTYISVHLYARADTLPYLPYHAAGSDLLYSIYSTLQSTLLYSTYLHTIQHTDHTDPISR